MSVTRKGKKSHGVSKIVERSSAGLRGFLFEQLEGLTMGNLTREEVLAGANQARQILATVKIEMDYQRLLQAIGEKRNARIPSLPLD